MSYGKTRDDEQLAKLDDAIRLFISRYQANPSRRNRKTVFLFPGGLGSQLLRASTPEPDGQPFFYNTVWLDCSILFGAGMHLQMQGDVDLNQQIIVADGPVNFMTLRPYTGFVQWCDQNGLDYFIFGWDWRRGLTATVDFFLDRFLPLFRRRVKNACSADPLQSFYLVGHSFGGMVIKLILNRNDNPYVQLMTGAITVATPFYGYGGQLPRFFEGDPDLNDLCGGKRSVVRLISSLAAGYRLLFLDEATYNRDRIALQHDAYPLASYPSKDRNNAAQLADPYNPKTNAGQVRYPQNYGFDLVELNRGKLLYQQVAAPLAGEVNNKFFNIRGVQRRNGLVLNETVNRQRWDWISPSFDPEANSCPIIDILGPGDDTLPTWSTRLVSTPAGNIRTLHGDFQHMTLMNEPIVLNELGGMIA